MYEIRLQTRDKEVIDARKIKTDNELFTHIGHWGVWYFLALETIDYRDAFLTCWGNEDGSDRLLAFTALKESDTIEGPHRHGLCKGVLAYGMSNDVCGKWSRVEIVVEQVE